MIVLFVLYSSQTALQRFANMARSRSFTEFLLITRTFILLLICLDNLKTAMDYDLLLYAGIFSTILLIST